MKLSKLVDPQFQNALRKLAAQDVPMKANKQLRNIMKQVNAALAEYDAVRTEALTRYGDKNEAGELIVDEGKSVKLSEDNGQQFVKELTELLNDDIEISTLKVADLGDKPTMSTAELMLLEDILLD